MTRQNRTVMVDMCGGRVTVSGGLQSLIMRWASREVGAASGASGSEPVRIPCGR
jgi:hypothetical protein